MKKITARAFSVLLIALLVVVGMGRYIMRYIDEGEKWALYFSRANSGASPNESEMALPVCVAAAHLPPAV